MKLIIDDNPELKASERGYDLDEMDVAKTVAEGIKLLEEKSYDTLYLDYDLKHGETGNDILNWLADHLDKTPEQIISVSFYPLDSNFIPKINALVATSKRLRATNE